MRKAVIKLFALSLSMFIISGCTQKDETLFPTTADSNNAASAKSSSAIKLQSDLPVLGTTVFEPIAIAQGQSTGTFVGQKVSSFRSELVNLQTAIKKHNDDLQKIRGSVIASSTDYTNSINDVETRLQAGTTPGNPYAVASLQKAQDNIKGMTGNAILTNQLSTRVVSDIAMTSYVVNSIKASYSVSGAVDEDHAQLKVLQDEAEKTNVILNNMLNEINNDYARQQQYIDTANKTILSLEEPVRVGRFGAYTRPSASDGATPIVPFSVAPAAKSIDVSAVQQESFSSRPLLAVKFNKNNVNYKDGLNRAVKGALQAKPTMMFDIVAVSPVSAAPEVKNTARTKATEIFQEVIAVGVSPENVSLSAKSKADANSSEVHIYVK
ncbi:MAG: hypothetical protein LBR70_00440 [Lactobacillaceae bacterium]|nr:hypothetical protein [Lactobacillaceae bacterium]